MRQSFSERMAEAKDMAQTARNRGQHVGTSAKGWNVKRPLEHANDNCAWLNAWRRAWQNDCREIVNTFKRDCLNMHDNPNTWEF